MPFVVDCSMTMAWMFSDEGDERTDDLRESLLGDFAVVPALWSLEVANVLLVATRRGRVAQSEWSPLLAILASLPIETDEETGARAWSHTLHLAASHALSVYDAVYLELALRRRLPLATLDRDLGSACRSRGVEVLPNAR